MIKITSVEFREYSRHPGEKSRSELVVSGDVRGFETALVGHCPTPSDDSVFYVPA